MSFRLGQLQPGSFTLGLGGLGIPAELVPDEGESGPAYFFDVIEPDDAGVELRAPITRMPTLGTLTVYPDGSFTYAGASDYALYEPRAWNQPIAGDIGYGPGIARVDFIVGAGAELAGGAQLDALAPGGSLSGGPSAIGGGLQLADAAPAGALVVNVSALSGALQLGNALAGGTIRSHPSDELPEVPPGFELFPYAPRRLEITGRKNMIERFDDKDPGERVPLAFNFSRDFDAVADTPEPVVSVVRLSGTADADPSAMMDGPPIVDGARVIQWCQGGNSGTRYYWRCEAYSPAGAKMVMTGEMIVIDA